MSITTLSFKAAIVAACAAAVATASYAQTGEDEPSLDRLIGLVDAAMPSVIGDDNSALVENLLGVELGTPLSRSFDFNKARAAVFGARVVPNLAPDCLRKTTPTGDPDQGECVASVGDENGGETFRSLSFSKNLGVGNIRFLYRPKVAEVNPGELRSVKMSNQEAYNMALAFLGQSFGLPLNELPIPPNADVLPVRSLIVGGDPQLQFEPVVVQKVVILRRGLKLPKPIVVPGTNKTLTHVPAPGFARVVFNADGNVVNAVVSGWQDITFPKTVDRSSPSLSRSELVREIATDLFDNSVGDIGSLHILIGLSSDFDGKTGSALPVVQVYVAPGGPGTEPTGPTSGGLLKEYALVDLKEASSER